MEAYDAAVLSYALATAATKTNNKPSLLGPPPRIIPQPPPEKEESLTPPQVRKAVLIEPKIDDCGVTNKGTVLPTLLSGVEQHFVNKTPVPLSHLMEICSCLTKQMDQQLVTHLETLQAELRLKCKSSPSSTHLMQLRICESEDDKPNDPGGANFINLKSEVVCRILCELLRIFGFHLGAGILKKKYP